MTVTTPHAALVTGQWAAGDRLLDWAERSGRRRVAEPRRGGLRFAFYGRVSTEDHQDPVSSRARQRDQAGALVAGYGRIVAEYFDIGQSRVLAWARRPEAAALADPGRGFDAIVVGEYERAFCGSQYSQMAPLFEHYGVQLWMPEAGGRVNFQAEGDEQAMISLGIKAIDREVRREQLGQLRPGAGRMDGQRAVDQDQGRSLVPLVVSDRRAVV
jgi:hypothetical protein